MRETMTMVKVTEWRIMVETCDMYYGTSTGWATMGVAETEEEVKTVWSNVYNDIVATSSWWMIYKPITYNNEKIPHIKCKKVTKFVAEE